MSDKDSEEIHTMDNDWFGECVERAVLEMKLTGARAERLRTRLAEYEQKLVDELEGQFGSIMTERMQIQDLRMLLLNIVQDVALIQRDECSRDGLHEAKTQACGVLSLALSSSIQPRKENNDADE